MLLANRVVLPDMRAVRKHQKSFRSEYECVIKRDADVVRYYSDSPALLIGLSIQDHLDEQGDQFGRLVYLQCFENNWYGAVFVDGQLIDEHLDQLPKLLETLGYDLHIADEIRIYGGKVDVYPDKQQCVDEALINLQTLPDDYRLKARSQPKKPLVLIGCGVLIVLIAAFAIGLSSTSPKTQTQQPTLSPEQQFTMTYGAKLHAANALSSAMRLSAELAVMPVGMTADTVRLVDSSLQSVVKYDDVRDKVKRQWFSEHRELTKFYAEDRALYDVPVETVRSLVIYDIADYLVQMRDALELLGVNVNKSEPQTFGNIQNVVFSLEMRGSAGLLPFIQEIIEAPMVTVSSLELVRESKDQVKLSLEIEVTGASNNE
ncbi:hypothetical protein ACQ5UC_15990 [Vibrio cholerae]|uniref:hypothetical protein n=1 Tax=Vibrio cholerae TaxID=666 RepID=UPI003D33EFD3